MRGERMKRSLSSMRQRGRAVLSRGIRSNPQRDQAKSGSVNGNGSAGKRVRPNSHPRSITVQGSRVVLDGEDFYQIANYDRLRPFFMTIVSSGDHWMFISSNGGLTAGRRNPDLALFPYY